MNVPDPKATISALMRMTVDRGCTPHEAATARERAAFIAKRLGLNLETFVPEPEGARPRRVTPEWAETVAKKAHERNEAYKRWRAAEAAEAAQRAQEFVKRREKLPPQPRLLLDLLTSDSWTSAELGRALGDLKEHTVRAMISGLRKAGFKINRTKRQRETVYNVSQ
jgi:hypothetical protein